jgi:hydroxyacylglutathione hydrolase
MSAPHLLEPDLRLLLAPNPSPMTGEGTNTYILGQSRLIVIDPGPDDPRHLAALTAAIGAASVEAILVTHAHLDHSPLARPLAQRTGAPVLAYGDARAGRSARMEALAAEGLSGGGEGVDAAFQPDRRLADDATLTLEGDTLRALWTPGHFGNHLCFAWRGAVFSGDHVMGWSSTFVSPPDGDIGAYMRALDRLEALLPRVLYPGHGAPVTNPTARIHALRAHRRAREAAILAALASPQTIPDLVARIYTDTPPALHRAAARNVFAHLIDLEERGQVTAAPGLCAEAVFRLSR